MTATRAGSSPSLWWSRRAVVAHIALAIWVPGCAVAAWWQVGIALGGDSLGWVYSVMWPCFAVFGVVFWWFLVHDDPDTVGARGLRRLRETSATGGSGGSGGHGGSEGSGGSGGSEGSGDTEPDDAAAIAQAEADDPELAEYNAYLASLATRQKSWRRR